MINFNSSFFVGKALSFSSHVPKLLQISSVLHGFTFSPRILASWHCYNSSRHYSHSSGYVYPKSRGQQSCALLRPRSVLPCSLLLPLGVLPETLAFLGLWMQSLSLSSHGVLLSNVFRCPNFSLKTRVI